MLVTKRDGTIEEFNLDKILIAVTKAFNSVGQLMPEYLNLMIPNILGLTNKDNINVEEIQDKIEQILMNDNHFEAAKSYIIYRERHKEAREIKDRLDYMEKYSKSTENAAASSETDANANISMKNVVTLESEVPKVKNRIIQRARMKEKLNIMFPEVAKQYEKDIEHHIIYIHDEASSAVPKNYCEAVSLFPLVSNGIKDMDGVTPKIANHLSSFCGQFNNLVFLLSAQCKGAVAFGEFFNYFDYYCVKDYGEDYHLKEQVYADSEHVRDRKTIGQKIEAAFQTIVYYINQPAQNRGWQSPFTNISYYDSKYWEALFKDFYFPDGTQPSWERVSYLQKKFMKWFNRERTKAMLTFPVETMALLTDKEGNYLDEEYKDFTAEMHSEGHSFFVYISDNPNGLASCCRLRNEIEENVFSFTNGLTGVKTGSCNVITLNLNRIVQDFIRSKYKEDAEAGIKLSSSVYPELASYLVDILERVYKYHTAYKTILYEWEERGMFNASTAGYIGMRDLFCTIGINGINEAARFLGIEVSYNDEYKEFCRLITGTISEQNKLHSSKKFKFNTELVPAEGLSSKNYNWDTEDGYWTPSDTKIYNSYFYNAWDPNTSVLDKFKLHGKEFTELLDGGVGLHCNLEEHLSKEQYLKLLDYAAERGTSYFTYNIPNSECTNESCHFIAKFPMDVCPKCGHPMRIWTRVVGFLRPIEGYDKGRYWDATQRVYSKNVN
ncbi:putative anaerobic ribonucleoside triphosphate reductase [uncultured phage cr18_1]|uniref:Anaerobic ribonucleoside triphosphate reductase n=1 Tax=uncultured phage cr18_1 TaxID=2986407 RepID=A0AAE7RY54_9CAUD|nr:anaerobic ribonucleoside reductase large subunit [uncultured phage cr18_1]QWM90093.1 putative anaerobic ribonucleoside triphosphate reductase [uncultured phage cr18_1]